MAAAGFSFSAVGQPNICLNRKAAGGSVGA